MAPTTSVFAQEKTFSGDNVRSVLQWRTHSLPRIDIGEHFARADAKTPREEIPN